MVEEEKDDMIRNSLSNFEKDISFYKICTEVQTLIRNYRHRQKNNGNDEKNSKNNRRNEILITGFEDGLSRPQILSAIHVLYEDFFIIRSCANMVLLLLRRVTN